MDNTDDMNDTNHENLDTNRDRDINSICDEILNDNDNIIPKINSIYKNTNEILHRERRDDSFFGVMVLAITTLVTNLWAQYIYHNTVTNYGQGTQGNSDSLLMLLIYTVIVAGIVILFDIGFI